MDQKQFNKTYREKVSDLYEKYGSWKKFGESISDSMGVSSSTAARYLSRVSRGEVEFRDDLKGTINRRANYFNNEKPRAIIEGMGDVLDKLEYASNNNVPVRWDDLVPEGYEIGAFDYNRLYDDEETAYVREAIEMGVEIKIEILTISKDGKEYVTRATLNTDSLEEAASQLMHHARRGYNKGGKESTVTTRFYL